jgi:hypothetical protein
VSRGAWCLDMVQCAQGAWCPGMALGCRGHMASVGSEWNVRLRVRTPGSGFRGSVKRYEAREVLQYHRGTVHHYKHRRTTSRSSYRASSRVRVKERVVKNHRSAVHQCEHKRTTSRIEDCRSCTEI